MVDVRALIRDALTYGTGDILSRALFALSVPLLTRVLGDEQFGLWMLLYALLGLGTSILGLGLDVVYSRFFFEVSSLADRRTLTTTWSLFLFGFSLLVSGGVWLLRAELSLLLLDTPHYGTELGVLFLVVPFTIANRALQQVPRNEYRSGIYSLLTVSTALVSVILAIIGSEWYGVRGAVSGLLLGEMCLVPVHLFVARRYITGVPSGSLLRKLVSFALPMVPAAGAYWILTSVDRVLLGRLRGLTEVGHYSVAALLSGALSLLAIAYGRAWLPRTIELWKKDEKSATVFCRTSLTAVVAAFLVIAVAILVLAPELLRLIGGKGYEDVVPLMAPLLTAAIFEVTTKVTAFGIIVASQSAKLATAAGLAAGCNLLLNLALIPSFGMQGAAWATAVAYAVLTYGFHRYSLKTVNPIYQRGRLLAIACLAGCVFFLLPEQVLHGSLVVRILVIVSVAAAALFIARSSDVEVAVEH